MDIVSITRELSQYVNMPEDARRNLLANLDELEAPAVVAPAPTVTPEASIPSSEVTAPDEAPAFAADAEPVNESPVPEASAAFQVPAEVPDEPVATPQPDAQSESSGDAVEPPAEPQVSPPWQQ